MILICTTSRVHRLVHLAYWKCTWQVVQTKGCQGLLQEAMQLTPEQQQELAGIAHSYTSAVQGLQQGAQALCDQLKETLLPFSAQSHMSMRLFNVAAALQDNLEEQHECGLQVVRQVCLQVTAAVTTYAVVRHRCGQHQLHTHPAGSAT